MSEFIQDAVSAVLSVIGAAFIAWCLFRGVKNSEEPAKIIIKAVFSVALVIGEFFFARKMLGLGGGAGEVGGYGVAFVVAGSIAACGIVLSIMWTPQISDFLVSPLTDLYDGGGKPLEPKPFYSIALAKRKKNQPLEAAAEVRKQLARFPNDYEGVNLLAAIQAEDLKDLPGAEMTLNQFCDLPESPPRQVAAALTLLADWHLKLAHDTYSARTALERIIAKFPGTDLANVAAQRIAHLGGTREILLAAQNRRPLAVPEGVKSIGLRDSMAHLVPAETDPAKQAAACVNHLAEHPLDTEAREKLAVIYAQHYQRLDLAAGELNQLADMPGQPAKSVAHWMNLLADLQVHGGADYDAVQPTLQKIIERFPGAPVAEMALTRLSHLRLEIKGQKETPDIKPGVYEQNIGLKYGSRR